MLHLFPPVNLACRSKCMSTRHFSRLFMTLSWPSTEASWQEGKKGKLWKQGRLEKKKWRRASSNSSVAARSSLKAHLPESLFPGVGSVSGRTLWPPSSRPRRPLSTESQLQGQKAALLSWAGCTATTALLRCPDSGRFIAAFWGETNGGEETPAVLQTAALSGSSGSSADLQSPRRHFSPYFSGQNTWLMTWLLVFFFLFAFHDRKCKKQQLRPPHLKQDGCLFFPRMSSAPLLNLHRLIMKMAIVLHGQTD